MREIEIQRDKGDIEIEGERWDIEGERGGIGGERGDTGLADQCYPAPGSLR